MERLQVNTQSASYSILIGTHVHESETACRDLSEIVKGKSLLLITDTNVGPIYGERFRSMTLEAGAATAPMIQFPAGEPSKNIEILQYLYRTALEDNLGRDSLFVALGGGVTGDLAGFAAATFMRGVDLVQIPTSLLAMVDSSVGGKVGIDLAEGKNLVGAFHQPRLVLTDVGSLKTLPSRELKCGLAEVAKYGVIMDPDLYVLLERNTDKLLACDLQLMEQVVKRCCELKAQVVEEDERELSGRRAILNYGHTFGHALESLTGYNSLNHGEGVSIGMVIAARLANNLGLADAAFVESQTNLLKALELPTDASRLNIPASEILACMKHDKKARAGRPRLILPRGIGNVELIEDVAEEAIIAAIRQCCE